MKKITLLIALMITSLGFSQNLITNGTFELPAGIAGWSGNAANLTTENGNSYNSANVLVAGAAYAVNLSYVLPLTTVGKAYKLTFDAFSDKDRTLVAGIGLAQDPWTAVVQTVNLSTTSKTYSLTLITNFASPTSRVIFDMGAATGFVGIDNVKLEETVSTCNNGIKDGDETGIDCGGSCAACPPPPPTVAAPTPPLRPAADVVSLFSDSYTSITPINLDAGWCGGGAVVATTAGDNNVFAYKGNPCQGITFPEATQNLIGFTNIHVDFFILEGTNIDGKVFNLKTVALNGAAVEINIDMNLLSPAPVAGTWYSFDRAFTAGQLAAIAANPVMHEFGVTSNLNNAVWYDNLYLHKNTILGTQKFEKANVKVYPNPVKNILTIEAKGSINKVSVYNLLGQEVLKASPKSTTATLQTSQLQKGVYMVKTDIDGTISTSKIVKE